MIKLWRRYKPFINAGVQELITYRVNFILYRIGDVMGAFVAFYLWKAVFDSSQESLIQGFSMADITLYIIMSFVTNLLTRSDSSFMIGEEVKDGSIIMRLLRPVHFAASYLFTELGSKWLIFISVGLPFLSVIVLMKIISGQGIVEVLGLTVLYLFSLTLAYLINFFFNICFGFSAFVFKNLWGSNLLKTSIVAFMSGSLIPLAFFPKVVSDILSFLPFSSLIYTSLKIATASIAFWTKQSGAMIYIFYMFNDFAKYPISIYNSLLRWLISFIVPFAFTAYYPASYFLQEKDVFFNVGGLMLISLVFFVISLKLWDKGLDSYESAGS